MSWPLGCHPADKARWFPYHLALLQLEHDASFQAHSSFSTLTDFLRFVIEILAQSAPQHHHLVFKAHPLEDGRVPLQGDIRKLAAKYGVAARVHFVRSGKLAALLDGAKSVVAVNSTAAQQALWRGLPLKAFGQAVYAKPEFVSQQNWRNSLQHQNARTCPHTTIFANFSWKRRESLAGFMRLARADNCCEKSWI